MQQLYGLESIIGIVCASLLLVIASAPWIQSLAVPGRRVVFSGLQVLLRILFLSLLLWIFRREITVFRLFENPVTLNELITLGMAFYLLVRGVLLLNTRAPGTVPHAGAAASVSFLTGLPVIIEGVLVVYVLTDSVAVMVASIFTAGALQTIFHRRIIWLVDSQKVLYTLTMGFYLILALVLMLESVSGGTLTVPKTYIYFAVTFGFALQLAYIRLRYKGRPHKSDL